MSSISSTNANNFFISIMSSCSIMSSTSKKGFLYLNLVIVGLFRIKSNNFSNGKYELYSKVTSASNVRGISASNEYIPKHCIFNTVTLLKWISSLKFNGYPLICKISRHLHISLIARKNPFCK